MQRLLYTGALRVPEGLEDQAPTVGAMHQADGPAPVMSTSNGLGGVVEREPLPPRESL